MLDYFYLLAMLGAAGGLLWICARGDYTTGSAFLIAAATAVMGLVAIIRGDAFSAWATGAAFGVWVVNAARATRQFRRDTVD